MYSGSFAAGNAWSLAAPFRTLNFTFNSVCVSYRLFNLHKATWRGNKFYGQVLTFNALGRLDVCPRSWLIMCEKCMFQFSSRCPEIEWFLVISSLSPLLAYLTRGMVPPNLRQPDPRPSSLIEQVKKRGSQVPIRCTSCGWKRGSTQHVHRLIWSLVSTSTWDLISNGLEAL